MKAIFEHNKDKGVITAYDLGDSKLVDRTVNKFLDGYGFAGFGDRETYKSSHDEGSRKLYFKQGEIFLQEEIDKDYVGMTQQSNFGVAGHGCDHYYQDSYRYTYSRKLLPKDIMAAFNCMYQTIYYSRLIDEIVNKNHCRYSVLEQERAILNSAKRNLSIASQPVSYDEFGKNNVDMVRRILGNIEVKSVKEYPISSVEDLINIFKSYHHPIQYCMSLYGQYNHKFTSLEQFYASLSTSDGNSDDRFYKQHINDVFQSFALTQEWLRFIEEVKNTKSNLLTRHR